MAAGSPDDVPYGGAETMPNVRPADVLQFHAMNTFAPHGEVTILRTERLEADAVVSKYNPCSCCLHKDPCSCCLHMIIRYGAEAEAATNGSAPYRMKPSMGPGGFAPDVGQVCRDATPPAYNMLPIVLLMLFLPLFLRLLLLLLIKQCCCDHQVCRAMARKFLLPPCKSRVWKVTLSAPLPPAARKYDIVSLKGWDARGLSVRDSKFFGGIDGVHVKSCGAVLGACILYYHEDPCNCIISSYLCC